METPERISNFYALSVTGLLVSAVALHIVAQPKRTAPPHFATAHVEGRRQLLVASFWTPDVVTSLDIRYTDVISENDDARVALTVRQRTVYRPTPGYENMAAGDDSPPSAEELHGLAWPIAPSLKSGAFDFGGEEIDMRPKGAALPLSLVWTATPKRAGNRELKLDTQTIYRPAKQQGDASRYEDSLMNMGAPMVTVTLNGKDQTVGADDDISLPITVHKSPGIPVEWYDWAALVGAVLTFLFGSTFGARWLKRFIRLASTGTHSTTQAPLALDRDKKAKQVPKPRAKKNQT